MSRIYLSYYLECGDYSFQYASNGEDLERLLIDGRDFSDDGQAIEDAYTALKKAGHDIQQDISNYVNRDEYLREPCRSYKDRVERRLEGNSFARKTGS